MMIITKRRTVLNPRPDMLEGQGLIGSSDDLLLGGSMEVASDDRDVKGTEFLTIKVSRKIIESSYKANINGTTSDF